MEKGRILLVDDDADLLRLLSLRMKTAGYAVSTAASGNEALSVLAMEHPSLVITDLKMDEMDGMALLDAIAATIRLCPSSSSLPMVPSLMLCWRQIRASLPSSPNPLTARI
jgi:two component, sigma54 specific, transcriptional regulator, Fis family